MNKQLFLLRIFALCSLSFSCFSEEQSMKKMLREASRGGTYQEISEAEMTSVTELFEKVLQGNITPAIKTLWENLGYEMIFSSEKKGNIVILKESHTAKFGRGLYWINLALPKKYALEIPHVPSDALTREISLQLLPEGQFFAIAWNTVRRSYREGEQLINADMAHLKKSYLMAFSRAISKQFPQGKIIQIHGFSENKRETEAGSRADMIVSSASHNPSHWVLKYANCMKHQSSYVVSVYPNEITELGGTRNTVALDLLKNGYSGFVHIEMSRKFREAMVDSDALRHSFSSCIAKD